MSVCLSTLKMGDLCHTGCVCMIDGLLQVCWSGHLVECLHYVLHLYVFTHVCLSVYICTDMFVCLFICLYICLNVGLFLLCLTEFDTNIHDWLADDIPFYDG